MAAAEQPTHPISERAERHLRVILVMVVVLLSAAFVSMSSIERSAEPLYKSVPDWSPLGYTYSLALFGFPLVALILWFRKHRRKHARHGRAFWLTMGVFSVLWCAVDIFLANLFFRFPNAAAHIKPMFWGYMWGQGFTHSIPYEEFAFYFGAISVILLLYLWSREEWYDALLAADPRITRSGPAAPHRSWICTGARCSGAPRHSPPRCSTRSSGPMTTMRACRGTSCCSGAMAVIPTALLTRRISPFMNDRALLFTIMAVMLVSLLWEVTLALPNGWWNYRHEHMMGLFMKPWNGHALRGGAAVADLRVVQRAALRDVPDLRVLGPARSWSFLFGRKSEA